MWTGAGLTVEVLAERLRVSERQLTRVFKNEPGTTPAAYVEAARVEIARSRLETTDDTLSCIAAECGFGTVGTLNRAFRRVLGVTPGEYRRRFRVG
nr:helix-turn-helix transcriptional regulator [Microbacterium esteraromaticum]